jgi:hypothetical protein
MRCAVALTKQHTITTSVLRGFTSDPEHWLETEKESKKKKVVHDRIFASFALRQCEL